MDQVTIWLQKEFEIDSNTSATIIITISVFLIGLVIQWLYGKGGNLIRRIRHRKMFIHLLEETIKSSVEQGKFFLKLAENLRIEHIGNFDLKTATLGYLTIFEKLDFKESYTAFFHGIENICNKHKIKAFTKAHSVISRTIGIEKKYPNDLKEFIEKFNKYEEKWNDSVDIIRQQYGSILTNMHFNHGLSNSDIQVEFSQEMELIIYKWTQSKNRTHFTVVFDELICPLKTHLINPKYSKITTQLKELTNQIMNAEIHYLNMKTTLAVYKDIFALYGRIYKGNKRYLELIVKILE